MQLIDARAMHRFAQRSREAAMTHPTGELNDEVLQRDLDRCVMLQFRGSVVTSDAGLSAYRKRDAHSD